jgi:ferredoxin-NADP reductase
MDREAGIDAYTKMVSANEHKARLAKGDTSHLHRRKDATESPVVPVVVSKVEKMSPTVTKYEFRHVDGHDLPEWTAGAHLDLVVAPEFLRQYSMSGDPADRSVYQIGVLREEQGRGGSALLHRIFAEGRRVFVSKPINHFPLVEDASFSWLMGGGIGVTPMIAMAHRLHALRRPFELHYSVKTRAEAGYLEDLANVPWADRVHIHVSDEGTRADLDALITDYAVGQHIYTCGPDIYMNSVMDAADSKGFPEDSRHLEYFAVPELPEYENHPFTLRLSDGRTFHIPADQTATDVLNANGVTVDLKCSDGICGVCKARVLSGVVEHRDFVLSKAQREDTIILCQSRAAKPDGEITIDL